MSVNDLLLQIVNFLTSQTPSQPRHLLLLARYQHPQQLPLLTDLLRLIYAGHQLHTRHPLHYPRLFQLLKTMLMSADLFFTLLLSSKIGPAILRDSSNPPIPRVLQQIVKPGNSSSRYSFGVNKMSMQAKNQAGKLLEWCQQSGYFQFYFHLLNKGQKNTRQHLHSFMLQVSSQEESPLNEEEREELRIQMLTECEKLDKKNHRQKALQGVYGWLKQEVISAFVQTKDSSASMRAKDVLSRVVETHHDLTCAALVHAIDRSCCQVPPQSIPSLLSFIDELVISGNTMTALHAILILSSSIFTRILRKQIALPYEAVSVHYKLWRQGMQKRQIDSKLLMCLDLWLPVIYQREPLTNEDFQEAFQLYRGQLAKLYKESRIGRVRVLLEEIEIKKIEEIYQEMEPFHSKLQALEESESNLQDKPLASVKATSKVSFSFNVSEASEKRDIHSLMQSLRTSRQDSKTIVQPPNQEQLKIYSKRHSIHNSHIESQTSVTQDIESILNLLSILQEPQLSSSFSIQQTSSFVQKTPFLPIVSKHSESNSEVQLLQISEDDPYGIRQRGKVSTKEIELNVVPLRSQTKRKIIKGRGLISKNAWMQIGYLIDSQYKRRRLTLFITFLRRIQTASMAVKEKSVKLWKKGKLTFLQPKLREQYKSTLQIQKIKTYQIQGIAKSHRYMRPKLQLSATDVKGQVMAEVHEIPVYLYNLQEWLEIPNNEMYMFELEAELGSGWKPLSPKILKNKEEELGSYFPLLRVDRKGNVCLKFCLLHEVIFAKIYLVMEEVRVVLVNSSWELALVALLEMVVGE